MKNEKSTYGYCIQVGERFVAEWYEPQFTSYYLSDFSNVHIFDSLEDAAKHKDEFPSSTIRKIKKTITYELI